MIRWPFRKRNPARELALIGVEKRRRDVKAKAREMLRDMDRPIPEVLS